MTLKQEIWHQNPFEKDLWAGENGLIINTAALRERASNFEIVEVPVQPTPVPDYGPVVEHTL